MLDATLKQQLSAYLTKLQRPIEILAATDDSPEAGEMLALLQEVAALNTKITLRQEQNPALRS